MVEQTAVRHIEESHKGHGRRLYGVRLWLARGAYIALFLLVITFFITGFQPYVKSWDQGNIGAGVTQNNSGQLVIYVFPGGDAATAGVQNGDILQAINGVPVSSPTEANELFVGKIGDPITITILPKHQFPHQVELTYAGGFLQLLERMHLSLKFLIIYNIVFSCLLGVAVILCSPLVFFRRSNDWLVILVAFSMIAFASIIVNSCGVWYGKIAHVLHEHSDLYARNCDHGDCIFPLSNRTFRTPLDPLGLRHNYCAGIVGLY